MRTSYMECCKETSPAFYNPSTSGSILYNATFRAQLLNLSWNQLTLEHVLKQILNIEKKF